MKGSEKGSVLVIVITGITIIAAIGGGLAAMVSSGARTGANYSLSVQALYVVESGVEWAGSALRDDSIYLNWNDRCTNLASHEDLPEQIGGQASFTIVNPKLSYLDDEVEDPTGCEITVVGWVGNDKDNPLAKRRIVGKIPVAFINNDGNFFNDVGWSGGGKGVNYKNGLEFDVNLKGNKDTESVKLNRNGSSDIVENDFDENKDIYFFVKITNWENVASFTIGHKNSWEGSCDPISDCLDSEENSMFKVKLENISNDNVNDSNVSLDVVFKESGTVFFELGCIASTIDNCTNTGSQNSVNSWTEG